MNLSEQRDVVPERENKLLLHELRNHFMVLAKSEPLVKH